MKLGHRLTVEAETQGRAFTGAWIETFAASPPPTRLPGRAFTGAWIETGQALCRDHIYQVAPSRARGLKLEITGDIRTMLGRAFTGAWIETADDKNVCCLVVVAPSRARGLKLFEPLYGVRRTLVAPSRARGLKHRLWIGRLCLTTSRAFTGAWIETRSFVDGTHGADVAPSRARGLKHPRRSG